MTISQAAQNNLPITFDFGADSIPIRVLFDENGDRLWVAADICRALDHSNASAAVSRLDDDEKGLTSASTPGGEQQLLVVTEAGLYSLILSSRQERAKEFKRWLTHEVLPAIRKRGRYEIGANDPEIEQALDSDPSVIQLRKLIDLKRDQLRIVREQAEIRARLLTTEDTAVKALEAARDAQRAAEATQATVTGRVDFISVLGYANIKGYKIPRGRLSVIGKRVAAQAREIGVPYSKGGDERFGTVNVFPRTFVETFDNLFRSESADAMQGVPAVPAITI